MGKDCFAQVSEFKGNTYVDIRKYYTDEAGESKPTKKGISLTIPEFEQLMSNFDLIDEMIADKK